MSVPNEGIFLEQLRIYNPGMHKHHWTQDTEQRQTKIYKHTHNKENWKYEQHGHHNN